MNIVCPGFANSDSPYFSSNGKIFSLQAGSKAHPAAKPIHSAISSISFQKITITKMITTRTRQPIGYRIDTLIDLKSPLQALLVTTEKLNQT